MQGFKIWKEQTLTSPSGIHLSLYKIWLHKTEDEDTMTANEFFCIYAKLFNGALEIGYPLRRWDTIHNLFILKEAQNYKIHQVRFLHIIEAQLNLIQ